MQTTAEPQVAIEFDRHDTPTVCYLIFRLDRQHFAPEVTLHLKHTP